MGVRQDETLKDKLKVQDWSEVDESRGRQIVEQVQSGVISKEEWDYLKAVVPNFLNVISVGLTTIGSLSTAIAASQSEALKAINEGIRAARDIANGSDDAAVKVEAIRAIEKGFEKAEAMNTENAFSWKMVLSLTGAVIAAAAGVIAIARSA